MEVEEDDVELVESELVDELLEVVTVEDVVEDVWLVDVVWDRLVEVFPPVELSTRYPPTAATMTTTTTTAAMTVLTALRPLRGNEDAFLGNMPLLPIISIYPAVSAVYMTSHNFSLLSGGKRLEMRCAGGSAQPNQELGAARPRAKVTRLPIRQFPTFSGTREAPGQRPNA